MKKRIALIDGDILAYRCGFAAEHTTYTMTLSEPYNEIKVFDGKREMNQFLKENPEIEEYEWISDLKVINFVLSTESVMV